MAAPSVTLPSILLTAVVAFAAGVLTTWLVLRQDSTPLPPPAPSTATHALPPIPTTSAPTTSPQSPAETLTAANQAYDRQEWPRAIELYQRTIALGLDNADVRTDLGNCYRFSNQPNDAIAQYEIAQRQDPRHEISFFNAATIQMEKLGDAPRAAELLEDYLRRFPTSPNAANARGILTQVKAQADPTAGVADWMRGSTEPTPKPAE